MALTADPIFNALTLGAGSAEGVVAADATAAVGGQVGPKFVGNAISGFTKHGIDQVINRGLSPSALLNAARAGPFSPPLGDATGSWPPVAVLPREVSGIC